MTAVARAQDLTPIDPHRRVSLAMQLLSADKQPLGTVEARLSIGEHGETESLTRKSDAEGRVKFEDLAPGSYTLRLDESVAPLGWSLRIKLGYLPFDLGQVTLPLTGEIRGQVFAHSPSGPQPVDGVEVQLSQQGVFANRIEATTTSRNGGCFTFARLPLSEYELETRSPDYRPATDSVTLDSAAPVALRLELKRGRNVRGTIVDGDGQPIADAWILYPDSWRPIDTGRRTDRAGRFELGGLGTRPEIVVQARGFETKTIRYDAALAAQRITLTPASTLRGRVTGAHAGRVRIELDAYQATPSHNVPRAPVPVAKDGSFAFAGLSRGYYTVVARLDGVQRARRSAVKVPQDEPLELAIGDSRTLTLKLVDDQERPVRDASVISVARPNYESLEQRTNSSGEVQLRLPLTTQALELSVRDPRVERITKRWDHGVPMIADIVRIEAPRTGTVIGRLNDTRDLAHFVVHASLSRTDGARGGGQVPISADGTFSATDLRAGRYRVTLSRRSWSAYPRYIRHELATAPLEPQALLGQGSQWSAEQQIVEVRAGQVSTVSIGRPPTTTLEGVVLAGGTPAVGAQVLASPWDPKDVARRGLGLWRSTRSHVFASRPMTRTDDSGRFRMTLEGPGRWTLWAQLPGSPDLGTPVLLNVTTQKPHRVELQVGAATVRGTLHLPDLLSKKLSIYLLPRELADRAVFCYPPDVRTFLRQHVERTATGDRPFVFPGLRPGRWVLRVGNGGEQALLRVLEVPESGILELGRVRRSRATRPVRLRPTAASMDGASHVFVRRADDQNLLIDLVPLNPTEATVILAPGSYDLELGYCDLWGRLPQIGPIHRHAKIEVLPDGTVQPDPIPFATAEKPRKK